MSFASTTMSDRSILFFSYLFPPRGGAGVQRALKFAKYLPQFGWKPLVIANGGTAEDGVTRAQDTGLLNDLPQGSVVRYTQLNESEQRRFQRMQNRWRQRLEPTDSMGWWIEPALRAAEQLLVDHNPQAIFVTLSPFTSAQVGVRLKQRTGLPLILDLRDPWALDETRVYPTRWHAARDLSAMRKALRAADLVIMNTPQAADAVRRTFHLPSSTRLTHLTNGFDAEDFTRAAPVDPARPDVLRIVHTGMFHSELAKVWDDLYSARGLTNRLKYPRRPINLWTRTPRYLLSAIDQLIRDASLQPEQIELVLVGELSESDRAMVDASPIRDRVRMLGYQSHTQSVGWVLSADCLFLPLHTPLDGGPALIVPGKAYEYLGSGRPILAMGPPGDMRDFVNQTNSGVTLDGDDIAGAASALYKLYEAKVQQDATATQDGSMVQRFERRALSQQLASELDQTLAARQPGLAAPRAPRPALNSAVGGAV